MRIYKQTEEKNRNNHIIITTRGDFIRTSVFVHGTSAHFKEVPACIPALPDP